MSLPALLATVTAIFAAYFAFSAGWWWVARHLPWWGFATMSTGSTLIYAVTKAVINVRRERRSTASLVQLALRKARI